MPKLSLDQLRDHVRGPIIARGTEGYEDARRVYNAMIDKRPQVVIRPRDVGDVMAAVSYARENELALSIRGGSHSVPGFGTNDDGVVIDLSLMRSVRVNPKARTAHAEGGATWGDFNHATHAFGLATTGGIISTTGIGGRSAGASAISRAA
jgi:FAD/FMN-containing dehydrogenase